MHLLESSAIEVDLLPMPPRPIGWKLVGGCHLGVLYDIVERRGRLLVRSHASPSAQPARRPCVLDDGPKANAWLGLMEKRGAIDELVAFFYDSLSSMMGQSEEFFGL